VEKTLQVLKDENAAVDESPNSRKTPVEQANDSQPATGTNRKDEPTENESVPIQGEAQEIADEKDVGESQKGIKANPSPGSVNEEAVVIPEKSDGGTNASHPETNTNKQALGDSEEAGHDLSVGTKEIHAKGDENANDETMDHDSTPSPGDIEQPEDTSDMVKDPDDPTSNDTDLNDESIATATVDDGGEPVVNVSSISAVTGVVKAAYNATSDAIKNVKDAIRTTVTSGKIGETNKEDKASESGKDDNEDNITLDAGTPKNNGAKGELESKTSQSADDVAIDEPSSGAIAQATETIASSSQPQAEDDPTIITRQDLAKPKMEDRSSKSEDANVAVAADSKPEKRTSVVKEVSKTKEDSSKSKESSKLKEGPKTAVDRDLSRRVTVTGKDDKSIGSSASDLFANLSRRFPHAACMKDLDFQAFKLKMLAANAGKNAGGGGDRGGPAGGAKKMEPIFNKITNEIKSVQITQNQYEQYISALNACYESVFYDMAKDLDSMQANVDQRLAGLERAVFLSEMRAKDRRPMFPSYDGLAKFISTLPPFEASAFQFVAAPTMPDGPIALCAGIAVLFLLLQRCLPWGKKNSKVKRVIPNKAMGEKPIAPATSPLRMSARPSESNSSHANSHSILAIPELILAKELLEKENRKLTKELVETKTQLANTSENYTSLQTQHAVLQQEHVALQQRHSQLAESAKLNGSSRGKEMKHIIFTGSGADGNSCMTPTPSVQSEPVSSETMVTPPKKSSGKHIADSPLKNRFRKKKNGSKNKQ